MRSIRLVASAAAAALLAAGVLLVGATPAAAGTPTCPSNTPIAGTVAGTVTSTSRWDYWYNDNIGPSTYTLTPTGGDADLYVYGADCSTQLCASSASGSAVDTCTVPAQNGRAYIGVYYFSGTGTINYTLSASNANGFPSDDCDTGAPIAQGFAGPNYVRVQSKQADASTTWVCVRAEGPSLATGGKFVVTGPGVTIPALPSTDANVGACATTGGNTVPGPHPTLKGELGDPSDPSTYVPFLVDSWAGGSDAWVCVGIGTVKVRAKVSTGVTWSAPNVVFLPDMAGGHTQEPPTIGTPSGTCQTDTVHSRYVDVTTPGTRTYLYTSQAPSVFKLCLRTQGLAIAGGVLTIDTTALNGALPSVTTGSNPATCGLRVARVDQPTVVEVRRSTSSLPAAACVTVGTTTVTVSASTGSGQDPVSVTWTPDAESIA